MKAKIEAEKGKEYVACNQKLIYAGKILEDEQLLSNYQIDEKKFVVVMVSKPQPAQAALPAQTAGKCSGEADG